MTPDQGGQKASPERPQGSGAMTTKGAKARRRPFLLLIPPPVLYAAVFGVGLSLDRLVPWSPHWMESEPARWIGWLCAIAAAVLGLASLSLFGLHGTTVIPQNRPTRLVTGGPFAISRNPMYIALTLAYCAAAVLTARAWPLVVLPIPLCVIDRVVIPFEERRMHEVFGAAYADYCRRVRRWL